MGSCPTGRLPVFEVMDDALYVSVDCTWGASLLLLPKIRCQFKHSNVHHHNQARLLTGWCTERTDPDQRAARLHTPKERFKRAHAAK